MIEGFTMSQFRFARISLILAALGLNVAPAMLGMTTAQAAETPAAAAPADAVRPEIFKLIDPAVVRDLMTAKNYPEVQSRIDQATALPNLTPYETFALNRMRIAVASATGNKEMAKTALTAVIESGRLTPADQGDFIQALANYYYNDKDYPNALIWFKRYQKDTGDTVKMRPYIIRSYYFGNDFENAKTELRADVDATIQAGKVPPIENLQLLANTGAKTKDTVTYMKAMEKLVQYYPNDDYWTDLLSRMQGKPGFAEALLADSLRLQFVAVKKMAAEDYITLAELDMLAGLPIEAKNVLDAGYANGTLGTGSKAAEVKKMRDQATKGAADDKKNIASGEASAMKSKDGVGLVNLGYAYVTLGEYDKGIDLIQKGIAKGNLKRPQDAVLRLGMSQAMAGKKDDAVKTLATVQGNEGQVDLAVYWTYWVNRPTTAAAPAAAAN
jgi:tetratricopeptide (TPR) repeat protein